MRKILIGLVLATILAMPIAVSAATSGPQECCKLRRAITLEGEKPDGGDLVLKKDAVVGPVGMSDKECKFGGVSGENITSQWGTVCLLNTFNGIVDWMFTILIILTVFFTILGAINIILAAGSAEKVSKGKDYILYAAIGLVVAFIARAIPGIIKGVMGF